MSASSTGNDAKQLAQEAKRQLHSWGELGTSLAQLPPVERASMYREMIEEILVTVEQPGGKNTRWQLTGGTITLKSSLDQAYYLFPIRSNGKQDGAVVLAIAL